MGEESDPQAITGTLASAIDAFNEEGYGVPTREAAIDSDADWKAQLTKACRLLAAVDRIAEEGYYTATIELCFGATERSVEAFRWPKAATTSTIFTTTRTATTAPPISDSSRPPRPRICGDCTTPIAQIVTTAGGVQPNDRQTRCSSCLEASTNTSRTRFRKVACVSAIQCDAPTDGVKLT